jgi:DNA-binding HxlR family transcriptional regulator
MKRKSLDEAFCPIARSLDQVGDWWSLLLVRDLMAGKRRFSDLHDSLGIARNMLSARLKRLIACEIIAPCPAADGSARQEYALTPKGRDLFTVLVALGQWGGRWTSCGNDFTLVEQATGLEIAPLEIRSSDGRKLAPSDIAFRAGAEGGGAAPESPPYSAACA